MEMPKILSINEAYYPHEGGAEKRSMEINKRLASKGFDVTVITNPFPDRTHYDDVDVRYITDLDESHYFKQNSRKLMGVLRYASRVRKFIRNNGDYDIYNFDEFPLIHALKGIEEVKNRNLAFFTWHEVLHDFYLENGMIWKIASRWEQEICQKFTNHITVSSTISKLLSDKYRVANTTVIENGVNRKEFLTNEDKEWGKIIYVGRLEPHKRLDQMIKTFKSQKDLELHIIGGGSQFDHLVSLVNGDKNIKIMGHLGNDELLEEVKNSWLFVMPSIREGFSIASLEAMAASVPVITMSSDYNMAANEVVRNGYNGFVSADFPDMIEKIRNLYKDEDEWKRISRNACDFTVKYDWDSIADKLAALYLSSW